MLKRKKSVGMVHSPEPSDPLYSNHPGSSELWQTTSGPIDPQLIHLDINTKPTNHEPTRQTLTLKIIEFTQLHWMAVFPVGKD